MDAIFLPFVVNEEAEPGNPTNNCNCPWIQTYPFIVKGSLPNARDEEKLLVPTLHFRYSRRLVREELLGCMAGRFGTTAPAIARAVKAGDSAQEEFARRVRARGREVLASLALGKTAAVMLGRPYNMGDPALNLHIVEKLLSLDVLPIPMDFLPLERENVFSRYPSMYWPNGRDILQAVRIVASDDRLQAIYVGNFRCGPDSFISHFVRGELRGKPYLQLEMDEHSADAGLITRLEAFLDSLRGRRAAREMGLSRPAANKAHPIRETDAFGAATPPRTLYFPNMSDGAYALAAACRYCGIEADVLPPLCERDLALGRAHTSSRECFPMICTTGSFLRKLIEPGVDPSAVSFFMPDHNGPCRFGQYNGLQRIIFDSLGFSDASIVHPSNENSYADLMPRKKVRFRLAVWKGVIAVDVLRKLLQECRPYEGRSGDTLSVYRDQLDRVIRCIERGGWGIGKALRRACEKFARVEVVRGRRKPVISVIGEIYMRDNPFCNANVVSRLEALGAETYMGPVRDWITYSTYRYTRDSRRKGRTLGFLRSKLQSVLQKAVEERLIRIAAEGGVEMFRDPPLEKMLDLCAPYIHRDYDGDPVLALGGAAGQAETGISGVVNILPFTCLPGTLVTAVSPRFCQDHDGIPWLNIAYDGQEDSSLETRLQAFIYRAEEFARRKGFDRPRAWPGRIGRRFHTPGSILHRLWRIAPLKRTALSWAACTLLNVAQGRFFNRNFRGGHRVASPGLPLPFREQRSASAKRNYRPCAPLSSEGCRPGECESRSLQAFNTCSPTKLAREAKSRKHVAQSVRDAEGAEGGPKDEVRRAEAKRSP